MIERHPPFRGVGVALVTLFDEEGEIDAPATADHAARLVDAGMAAVLVAGTTGEADTLDADERSDLLLAVTSAVDGRVPVLAGTGAPSARQAVILSKRAEADGADALLVLAPPGLVDPRPYYERVVDSVDIPVLAYHYPKRSAPGVPVDGLSELPVAGLKDSSGDAQRLILEADELGDGLYTGSPALITLASSIGCAGAILGLANVDPEGCLRAWDGDGTCQRELINGHRPQALAGIAGLKRALSALHGTSPTTRV
ncbi:MAG TPA: dihydrodipicolinate synthase family protein [Acidimicrobiales bacterium]|nr:dihydrodipicolinate synthase family protein [Acidimicrobiales bacterium]